MLSFLVCLLCTCLDWPLFEAVSLLRHHSSSTGASAGRPLGPLSPPVRGHLQLLLQTVGRDNVLLIKHTHTHKGRFIQTHNAKAGIDFVFFNIMKQQIVIALFVHVLPLTPSVRFVKRSVKSEDYHSAHSHIQTRSFSERWTACFVLRHASRIPDVQEQQQFRSTAASWHSAERHCSGRWNLHWAPRKRFETQQLWGRTGDAGNTRRAAFSGQRGTDECEGTEAGEKFVWFY